MTDELHNRVRFKLKRDTHNWIVMRSYLSKKDTKIAPDDLWKPESYHISLKFAARHMLERLVSEGYKPHGLEALVVRVEEAERRVLAFCAAYQENPDVEVRAIK